LVRSGLAHRLRRLVHLIRDLKSTVGVAAERVDAHAVLVEAHARRDIGRLFAVVVADEAVEDDAFVEVQVGRVVLLAQINLGKTAAAEGAALVN